MKNFIAVCLVFIRRQVGPVCRHKIAREHSRRYRCQARSSPNPARQPPGHDAATNTGRATEASRSSSTGQQQQQQEQLRIVADPATNSLVVYGTVQEYQNVKNILKELDAIPRQVLIEALILQIDLRDSEDFGVDYELFRKSRQTIFGQTFGSNAAITTLGTLFPASPAFLGVAGPSAIVGDDTVSAMIRAAATNSRIKVLSSPSVIASDNKPARIQVGSEEPVATGTLQAAWFGSHSFTIHDHSVSQHRPDTDDHSTGEFTRISEFANQGGSQCAGRRCHGRTRHIPSVQHSRRGNHGSGSRW